MKRRNGEYLRRRIQILNRHCPHLLHPTLTFRQRCGSQRASGRLKPNRGSSKVVGMSEQAERERDGVDPILRYATTMVLGLLIAGFLAVWLEAGFKNGAAVGVAAGILVGYLMEHAGSDSEQDGDVDD